MKISLVILGLAAALVVAPRSTVRAAESDGASRGFSSGNPAGRGARG
ncbi:hypothetical protein [Candidatus Laterigemmans baculatus]|nr:hypothetical protein [Candidatus Laterigemmans baculatus]